MKRFRVDIPLGTLVLQFDADDEAAAEKIINSIEAEIHPPAGGIEWQEVGYDASAEIAGAASGKKQTRQLASVLDTGTPLSEDDLRLLRENEELSRQLQEAMGRK